MQDHGRFDTTTLFRVPHTAAHVRHRADNLLQREITRSLQQISRQLCTPSDRELVKLMRGLLSPSWRAHVRLQHATVFRDLRRENASPGTRELLDKLGQDHQEILTAQLALETLLDEYLVWQTENAKRLRECLETVCTLRQLHAERESHLLPFPAETGCDDFTVCRARGLPAADAAAPVRG